MKILHISDTHCDDSIMKKLLERNEPVDLLIHSGDALSDGIYDAFMLRYLIDFFQNYPAKHKIFVPGNHDLIFDNSLMSSVSVTDSQKKEIDRLTSELKKSAHVLINDYVMIDDHKVWGTPFQPVFFNWAFNLKFDLLEQIHSKIHKDTSILISHAPPFGALDKTSLLKNVGDIALLEALSDMPYLKACFFGHIHEDFGEKVVNNIFFKNASVPFVTANKVDLDFFYVDLDL